MASRKEQKEELRAQRLARQAEQERAARARRLKLQLAGVLALALVGLGVLFALNSGGGEADGGGESGSAKAGEFAFAVGAPGPGEKAPPFELTSTTGEQFDLSQMRGKRVLLYFQEGLMCQPCWDQIVDLETEREKLESLGIDELVSITSDSLDQLVMKVGDEGIETPVLADTDLSVIRAYEANNYGMMGDSRAGHSFVLVGPDGTIEHRADYGGAPDFTMYVPVDNVVADIRKGLRDA